MITILKYKGLFLCLFILTIIELVFTSDICAEGGFIQMRANQNANQPTIFNPGIDVVVDSRVIGVTGGAIRIEDSGTPIDDISVCIPENALPSDSNVKIGYNTGVPMPKDEAYGGVTLFLSVERVTEFQVPIEITVPFNNPAHVPVPYYIDEKGRLGSVQLIRVERDLGSFTFSTFHTAYPSWFTWFLVKTIRH
jgi:hypothetical protein